MLNNLKNYILGIYIHNITELFEVFFLYYKKKYQLNDSVNKFTNKKYKYFDYRLKIKNSKFIQIYSIYLYLRNKKLKNYTFFDLGCGWGNVIFFLNLRKIFNKYVGYDFNIRALTFCKKNSYQIIE